MRIRCILLREDTPRANHRQNRNQLLRRAPIQKNPNGDNATHLITGQRAGDEHSRPIPPRRRRPLGRSLGDGDRRQILPQPQTDEAAADETRGAGAGESTESGEGRQQRVGEVPHDWILERVVEQRESVRELEAEHF